MIKIIVITIIVIFCLYFFYKRGQYVEKMKLVDLSSVNKETLEGILKLDDVVNIFKSKNLNQAKDIPFVSKKLEGLNVVPSGILNKSGYESIVLGINYETSIEIIEIIYAQDFDKKLKDIFAGRDLVVLN